MTQTVLLVGATGMFGSRIAYHLNRQADASVRLLVRDVRAAKQRLDPLVVQGAELIAGDLADLASLDRAKPEFDQSALEAIFVAEGLGQTRPALLAELLSELPPGQRLTVPRGTPAHLPAWVSMEMTDWDLRWIEAPPPAQRGEDAVEDLADDAEVAALLTVSNPTASALPGDPAVRRWVGLRDGQSLIACAADTSASTGVGHLSSIAVHPAARGRGLGAVITAALTRQLFEDGCDIVTLGMYADNTYGRAMYDELGFADDHRFTSGSLLVRGRW